jgi:hypothetical protein
LAVAVTLAIAVAGGCRWIWARTREVKLAVFFTQDQLDDKGVPVRDRDSASYIATFEPASGMSR